MYAAELTLSKEELTHLFTDVSRLKTLYAISQLPGSQGFYNWFPKTICSVLDLACASFSLIAEDRLYFESVAGRDGFDSQSLAAVARVVVTADQPVAVSDAKAQERYKDLGVVPVEGVGAYLGVQMGFHDGNRLGALCAFDESPREWDATDVAILSELTQIIVAEFEMRASVFIDRANKTPLNDLRQRIEAGLFPLDTRAPKSEFLDALRSARRQHDF